MWLISNKILFKDNSIFENFCDYHCHLLSGVDGGVQEPDESYNILNINTMGHYVNWKSSGVCSNSTSLPWSVPTALKRKKAEMLLNKGMYDCCGTDTHSARFIGYMLNSKVSKKGKGN